MTNITINVSSFTRVPGGRLKGSGDNSAEEFFEEYILPKLHDEGVDHITIDFSGTWGYPVSFTSQLGLFLKDELGSFDAVKKKISVVANDDLLVVDRFWKQAKEDS